MFLVHRLNEIEFGSLLFAVQAFVGDMLNEFVDRFVFGVDVRPLEYSRQKTGLPILLFLNGVSARAHGDEGR